MTTLASLCAGLELGRVTARKLVEQSLVRIADPAGEGARAFISVNAKRALNEADKHDAARKLGRAVSPFAGIPFGVKDLFDVAGEVTTAGSVLLCNSAPAEKDSDVVAQLRALGFIPIGRTNMTEFAYSGVGLNPHYGTPLSIYDRSHKRIPGGSSSGLAVAVADGMVPFGLGTDTGGSCRIPAAFNGIVGFKPTANCVSKKGVYPLSPSFDSVGPLANSVACCEVLHQIFSNQKKHVPASSRHLRIGVLTTLVQGGLDDAVLADFERSLVQLKNAGVDIVPVAFPELERLPEFLVNGGIVAAEAWKIHAEMISESEAFYDPRVSSRLRIGARNSDDDLARYLRGRAEMISAFAMLEADFDAIVCPTVAVQPPLFEALYSEEDYRSQNLLCLRNTYVFNFLDACSINLPMHKLGAAPTGLMLSKAGGGDFALFDVAERVEMILNS